MAFESAAIGMMLVGADGHPFQVNQALVEMLGYSAEELCSVTFADITHPDDVEPNLAFFRQALAGEIDRYQLDKRFLHKQGQVVWGRVSAGVVQDTAGQALYVVGHVEDITERKRLEQEREKVNQELGRLQALTDTALSHLALDDLLQELLARIASVIGVEDVCILLLDADGQQLRLQATQGLADAVAVGATIPVGQGLSGRVAEARAPLVAEELSTFPLWYPQARETEQSAAAVPLVVEERLLGVVYVGSAAPHRFTEAEMQLLQRAADRIALAIDRTRAYAAAQAAQAEAERQAEELDRIFEAVGDGLVVYDQAGNEIRANAAKARLLGQHAMPPNYTQLSVRERMALFDARDSSGRLLAPHEGPLPRALAGLLLTGAETMDIYSHTLDGREIVMSVTAATLCDSGGQPAGAVCVFRDETERKRLEQEREAARSDAIEQREVNWRMDAFLAIASHDVRAPVTVAVGMVQLARTWTQRLVVMLRAFAAQTERLRPVPTLPTGDTWTGIVELSERVQEAIIAADQSVDRLSHMVTVLFDTVQARAGRMELHRIPADLLLLARRQVDALRGVVPGRQIVVELPERSTLRMLLDVDRIGQVLTNYLTNALKYSPPSRPVTVRIQALAERVTVAVRDHGPGLPVEEQGLVWQMFHRAPNVEAQSTSGEGLGLGLGLGLHICKLIIEEHGGQVGVESHVGEGSTFWFTLPLASIADADGT